MSDEKFQSFWHGELSTREKLCLKSFTNRSKKFDLYTYDRSISVPKNVNLKDASTIYPRDKVFKYNSGPGQGSVAAFADFFRYKLLYERGGWWVDMDVIYTGQDVPESDIYFGEANESYIGNAIIKFPRKNELIEELYLRAERMGKQEASKEWGKSGPKLITKVIKNRGLKKEARKVNYAYPLTWREAAKYYIPESKRLIERRAKGAPFLHLWNEILGRVGFHKEVVPPKNSYLEKQAKKLNQNWPCPEVQYSKQTVENMFRNWKKARNAQSRRNEKKQESSNSILGSLRRIIGEQ